MAGRGWFESDMIGGLVQAMVALGRNRPSVEKAMVSDCA